ncbi:MAG: glycosyltransferase [Lachnospiraceae bacterium]|nr:glycosyltransferase [Lachnospiraceae bacterium]
MKILHIGISEHLGGIETYLYKIASNIDLIEYQFDFLTYPGITPCFYNELSAMGCKFQRVTPRRESVINFRRDFSALMKLEQYDIVHCHQNTLSFTEPIEIALREQKKVIVHSRNSQFIGRRTSKFLHNLHYLILPRKNIKMLAVSDLAGQWMFGKRANFTVLNNGVDLNKFHFNVEGRQRIRSEFIIGNEKLIIHTGAFREQKNHEFLIEIFAELHKLEPEAKLMLVGSGELLPQIQEKVQNLNLNESVIFTGRRDDIPDILSAGDIFLFPSFYEGFPNSLIEAEACGLYCVAADTITEQAKIEGLCEYISLDKSAEDWAKRIHMIVPLSDRGKCIERIRECGLDAESDVKRLTDIYDSLVRM